MENVPGEKKLLLSLWVLAALFVALWKFWPNTSPSFSKRKPKVVVGDSLRSWFIDGFIEEIPPGGYRLALHWAPSYRDRSLAKEPDSAEDTASVTLAYQFRNGERTIYEGSTKCALQPTEPSTTIVVPNPEHHHPQTIYLYLAH